MSQVHIYLAEYLVLLSGSVAQLSHVMLYSGHLVLCDVS